MSVTCLYGNLNSTAATVDGLSMPDAIFVLSAGIKKVVRKNGTTRYRSTAFSDLDPRGLLGGGKARVIAAAELALAFPRTFLVTTSHVEPDLPSHARVMADELEKYKVPRERIILEEKSTSTITELVEMLSLANEREWNSVWLVTNEYHIPRVQEMYNCLSSLVSAQNKEFTRNLIAFHEKNPTIVLVSAEQVLKSCRGCHYVYLFEKVEKTQAYAGRVAAEAHGIECLRNGTYHIR